jgi:hypothetical protein
MKGGTRETTWDFWESLSENVTYQPRPKGLERATSEYWGEEFQAEITCKTPDRAWGCSTWGIKRKSEWQLNRGWKETGIV